MLGGFENQYMRCLTKLQNRLDKVSDKNNGKMTALESPLTIKVTARDGLAMLKSNSINISNGVEKALCVTRVCKEVPESLENGINSISIILNLAELYHNTTDKCFVNFIVLDRKLNICCSMLQLEMLKQVPYTLFTLSILQHLVSWHLNISRGTIVLTVGSVLLHANDNNDINEAQRVLDKYHVMRCVSKNSREVLMDSAVLLDFMSRYNIGVSQETLYEFVYGCIKTQPKLCTDTAVQRITDATVNNVRVVDVQTLDYFMNAYKNGGGVV